MTIAGVDGGGTHTRLELRDDRNILIRREDFGPFNLNSIGEPAFRGRLREVFAAIGMADCGRLCIGGAGVSNPRLREILTEELKNADFSGLWKLCGDQEIALRGAMEEPGAVIISGTGSICFGRNASGETARSGGFGHLIDDGGSGYAIGRDLLSAAVRAADGSSENRRILKAVCHRLGVQTVPELIAFVYAPTTDKSAIAKVSYLALDLVDDPAVREILDREAEELCQMVQAVQKRLNLDGCKVALLGGLLNWENPYRQIVLERLSRIAVPVEPLHDALWGAAQTAWEL